MEDLKKWIGRKFLDFCKSDPLDERKIAYTMYEKGKGKKVFTSDEIVSMETLEKIGEATIADLWMKENWWYVSLEYKEEADMQEITMLKMGRLEAERADYKQMYTECFPHLAIVADILKKFRESGNIESDGASIYITADGYISMSNAPGGWDLTRLSRDSKPEIKCEVREEVVEA